MYNKLQTDYLKLIGHLEDLDIDSMIILVYILKKCLKVWTGFIRLRLRTSDSCEHGNEFIGFTEAGSVLIS